MPTGSGIRTQSSKFHADVSGCAIDAVSFAVAGAADRPFALPMKPLDLAILNALWHGLAAIIVANAVAISLLGTIIDARGAVAQAARPGLR